MLEARKCVIIVIALGLAEGMPSYVTNTVECNSEC